MDRSALFVAYNAAKKAAKAGALDGGRLNRGLGLAQRREPRPYNTTAESCDCPDRTYHGTCSECGRSCRRQAFSPCHGVRVDPLTCKHMLGQILKEASQ